MKFHRVEGVFPAGVTPTVAVQMVALPPTGEGPFWKEFLSMFDGDQSLARRVERLVSTEPVKITIDVPEKFAAVTARVLRAMADELDGEQR
jgi:hypothetical protein